MIFEFEHRRYCIEDREDTNLLGSSRSLVLVVVLLTLQSTQYVSPFDDFTFVLVSNGILTFWEAKLTKMLDILLFFLCVFGVEVGVGRWLVDIDSIEFIPTNYHNYLTSELRYSNNH